MFVLILFLARFKLVSSLVYCCILMFSAQPTSETLRVQCGELYVLKTQLKPKLYVQIYRA